MPPRGLAQPANDNFADRIALTGSSLLVTGSNVGATREPGEPSHAGWSGSASVWWSWVAPATTSARFDTVGSGFSTVLAIYTGDVLSNLTAVASAAQSFWTNGAYASQAGFVATAGVEYQIAVDTEWSATSNVVLNLVSGAPIITSQPQTQAASPGSNVTFSVAAAGDPPICYQWTRNGKAIAAATNADLSLTNVQAADAATYAVMVTNDLGSTASRSAVLSVPVYEPYFFTTIAGKAGTSGSADGPGDVARFNDPDAVALDGAGNLYVTEYYNHTVRKLEPAGSNWVVSTVAGTAGASGFLDGTNSDARFSYPNGVAVDSAGVLYVTDRGNGALRRIVSVGTNWVVSTIATGFLSPGGCAVDSAGNIYVADSSSLKEISLVGTNWVVTNLRLTHGYAFDRVAVDAATNLYASATSSDVICKITPGSPSWVVSILAGKSGQSAAADGTNSNARFSSPEGVAVDSAGSVYVGDYGNATVRKITAAGITTTLGGLAAVLGNTDGEGAAARFVEPNGVAVDSHGNVYVVDSLEHTIRMGSPVVRMQCPASTRSSEIQTEGFGLSMSVASGLSYRIQTSTDLSTWTDLTNFTAPGLTFSFLDEGATNLPRRFYRAVGP